MNNNIQSGRNYGIDLLKTISMLMVVVLHVLGRGGVLDAGISSINHWSAWGLEILCYGAVNCFALTTGYLMVDRPFKYRKIIPLYATVLFWCLVLSAISFVLQPETLTLVNIFKTFPVTGRQFWYFTSYFCLFFFIPFLNYFIEKSSKKVF